MSRKIVIGDNEIELKESAIKWTLTTTQAVFNKRREYSAEHAGSRFKFLVGKAGAQVVQAMAVVNAKGETVMAANGSGVLLKKIYNLVANSAEAVRRLEPVLMAAVDAEEGGDKDLAADLYNYYLNRTAISFNVLSTSSQYEQDLCMSEIEAELQEVKTENGSILTIAAGTIKVLKAEYGAKAAELPSNPFARIAAQRKAATGKDGSGEGVRTHQVNIPEGAALTV